MKIGQLKFY